MKQEKIQIVLYSNDIELAEKFRKVIDQESKYFKEETTIISEEREFNILKDVNILIILINDELEEKIKSYNSNEINDKAEKVVIIDIQKQNMVEDKVIKTIGNNQDEKAIVFSILYDYSMKLKKKIEESELIYNKKMLEETMEKFNTDDNERKIFNKIDEVIMENKLNYSIGYEKLKTMIYFCIINKLNIDKEKRYNYFYKAIARIFNENVNVVIKDIGATLNLIRRRKRKLKIQEKIQEMKGKQIVEQIILISKIVENSL